jgi:3-phosphoshikimate 1-carboxyvinyltransferase
MQSLLKDLRERDARDAARPVAPLMKLPDAALLDTTERNVEQAVAFVLDLVEKGGKFSG